MRLVWSNPIPNLHPNPSPNPVLNPGPNPSPTTPPPPNPTPQRSVGFACLAADTKEDPEGLGLRDAFALSVVVGAPVALLRYWASSPATTALLVATLLTLDRLLDSIAADESNAVVIGG